MHRRPTSTKPPTPRQPSRPTPRPSLPIRPPIPWPTRAPRPSRAPRRKSPASAAAPSRCPAVRAPPSPTTRASGRCPTTRSRATGNAGTSASQWCSPARPASVPPSPRHVRPDRALRPRTPRGFFVVAGSPLWFLGEASRESGTYPYSPGGITTHSGSSNSPIRRISQPGAALLMIAFTVGSRLASIASRLALLSQWAMAIRVVGSSILRCSSVPRAPGARWMISLARTQASAYSSAVWPSLMWTSNMYFIAPFALSAHGIDQYRKSFTGRLADLLLYWSVHFVTTRGRTMGWIMTLIIGGIVGWLASIIMKTNEQMGLIANIIVGIIGSLLGFWIAGLLGFEEGGAIIRFIIAIGGAVLLIFILRAIGVFKKA